MILKNFSLSCFGIFPQSFKKLFLLKISRRRQGFSMIELSVVILIIGILISGILASRTIIAKFRITTAQTLTISSPVNGIPDSTIWLESSLEKSFKDSESSDTNALSAWYDIRESLNKNNAVQTNSANAPTYSNTINYIHAVKFDGTNGYLTIPDASFLNNSSYTIFVLEKRESNKSNNYFIGDSTSGNESTTNKNLTLGYSADGTIKHSQSSDNSYTSSITTYAASSDKPRIFAFVHDKTSGKKTYINGLLAATNSNTENLTGITSLRIGSGYQGQIGEIIMFGRAITTEERQSVEDYLGKKWTSPILRTSGNSSLGGSCVGGTVSTSGCQLTCTVPATTGITTTTVADGSGSLICDSSSGFKTTPTLSYSCSNGTFSFTGSSSCSCQDGYNAVGSSCVISTCSFSGVNGIANGTSVNYTTTPTTRSCDSGYSGSVTYTCSGSGSPSVSSNTCVASNPCTGGSSTTTTISGTSYKIHTFSSSGSFSCPSTISADVLVVAGGGGGGKGGGGGGGAGGVVYGNVSLPSGSYTVTVGSGGAGGTATGVTGANGQNSSIVGGSTSILAYGGGGGAAIYYVTPANGGSGGGAGSDACGRSGGSAIAGVGAASYGNKGGNSGGCGHSGAGGGGGAGTAGQNTGNFASPSLASAGYGGDGISIAITGSAIYYGGGGGGGYHNNTTYGAGGQGGGGRGGGSTTIDPVAGTDGLGGGGGGGKSNGNGASGGSGIVIIRYPN